MPLLVGLSRCFAAVFVKVDGHNLFGWIFTAGLLVCYWWILCHHWLVEVDALPPFFFSGGCYRTIPIIRALSLGVLGNGVSLLQAQFLGKPCLGCRVGCVLPRASSAVCGCKFILCFYVLSFVLFCWPCPAWLHQNLSTNCLSAKAQSKKII